MPVITRVGVVVPARDESRLLPRCLTALSVAGDHLRAVRPDVELQIVVVLDSCTDDSAQIVRSHPGILAASTVVGIVGAARQVGIRRLARALDPHWFAVTDADSAVPADWLERQIQIGSDGADLILGTVIPDGTEISAGRLARWEQVHSNVDGHGHVYGANLGFSRRALEVTGGFRALAVHEDVDLADRVKAAGLRWVAAAGLPVLTSARTVGRTPDGFAGYLRAN